MKKTRSSGSKSMSPHRPWLGDPARRHADRRDPAGIFLEHVRAMTPCPREPARADRDASASAQTVPEMASRGSFCPPLIASLILARMLSIGMAGVQQHAEDRAVVRRASCTTGTMSSIAASMPAVAAWQRASTCLVAGVIGDAVDHRLRPRVHVLEAHVGQAGDVLQAFGRQRQRERLAEIGCAAAARARRGCGRHGPGIARIQVSPHGARRHRGKHRLPLRHVRIAILAHHVVAHQRVHQPGRLMRAEHVDALLLSEDVVAPGEHGRAELRHEGDRRFLAQSARAPDRDRPRTRPCRCRNAGRCSWRSLSDFSPVPVVARPLSASHCTIS